MKDHIIFINKTYGIWSKFNLFSTSTPRAKATTPTNSNQQIGEVAGRKLTTSQEAMKAKILELMDTCNELAEVLDKKEAKIKALDKAIAGSV